MNIGERRHRYYCEKCNVHIIFVNVTNLPRIICIADTHSELHYAYWKAVHPPTKLRLMKERLLKNLAILKDLGIFPKTKKNKNRTTFDD